MFNFDAISQTAWISEGESFTDMITGETQTAEAVTIEGYGFRWLFKKYD